MTHVSQICKGKEILKSCFFIHLCLMVSAQESRVTGGMLKSRADIQEEINEMAEDSVGGLES